MSDSHKLAESRTGREIVLMTLYRLGIATNYFVVILIIDERFPHPFTLTQQVLRFVCHAQIVG